MRILSAESLRVHAELADRLAWLRDGNELDEYPGPGWSSPSPADVAEYAAWLYGDDHDAQPDPNDLHAHTLSDLGYFHEYLLPHEQEGDGR
jgi:hypothetical protein